MISEIKKIEDCKILLIKDEMIYYCVKNMLYINKLDNDEIKIVKLDDIPWKMWFANGKIWLVNDRLQQICKSDCDLIANKINIKLNNLNITEIFECNLLRYYSKDQFALMGLYDIKNEEIIFESTSFFGNLYTNGFLIQTGPRLRCLDIIKKDIVFDSIDLDENFKKVGRIITMDQNSILCTMSDSSIVKINTKTMEYKSWKKFDKDYLSLKTLNTEVRIPYLVNQFDNYSRRTATYIEEKHKVIGFEYGVYWEIDLTNDQISVKSLYDIFDRQEISGCWSGLAVKNEYVYFFSDQAYHQNMDHKLVEFNIDKFEIIDSWQLPKGKYRSGFDIWGPTFLNSNILGAKDQNGAYHIFKIDSKNFKNSVS